MAWGVVVVECSSKWRRGWPVLAWIGHLWMAGFGKSHGDGFLLRPYTGAFLEVSLRLHDDQTLLVHPPNPCKVKSYCLWMAKQR